jgi:hypothetical protein
MNRARMRYILNISLLRSFQARSQYRVGASQTLIEREMPLPPPSIFLSKNVTANGQYPTFVWETQARAISGWALPAVWVSPCHDCSALRKIKGDMKCPRCESILSPVEYDGAQIEVCPDCGGEWLDSGELESVVEHHEEIFTPAEIASIDGVNKEIFSAEKDDHDELNCPRCPGVRMEHFNYGDTSGIILHKCPECGGIWTDKDQLEKVEMLVDGWKDRLNQDSGRYSSVLRKIELKEKQDLDKSVSISRFGFVNAVLRRFCE